MAFLLVDKYCGSQQALQASEADAVKGRGFKSESDRRIADVLYLMFVLLVRMCGYLVAVRCRSSPPWYAHWSPDNTLNTSARHHTTLSLRLAALCASRFCIQDGASLTMWSFNA